MKGPITNRLTFTHSKESIPYLKIDLKRAYQAIIEHQKFEGTLTEFLTFRKIPIPELRHIVRGVFFDDIFEISMTLLAKVESDLSGSSVSYSGIQSSLKRYRELEEIDPVHVANITKIIQYYRLRMPSGYYAGKLLTEVPNEHLKQCLKDEIFEIHPDHLDWTQAFLTAHSSQLTAHSSQLTAPKPTH